MKTTSISELKAKLSEKLRLVKTGEELVVTDRGRPVAMLVPLESPGGIEDLVESGQIRPGRGELPREFWERGRGRDPQASVRAAVSEERSEGW